VTVSSAIDERVSELVAAHREELAELVWRALDRELAVLVDVELSRLAELGANGAAHAARVVSAIADTAPTVEAQARELCSRCGEHPRLPERTLCRRCKTARDLELRRQRRREKRDRPAVAAADEEPPRAPDART
jgi:hypothetical protein